MSGTAAEEFQQKHPRLQHLQAECAALLSTVISVLSQVPVRPSGSCKGSGAHFSFAAFCLEALCFTVCAPYLGSLQRMGNAKEQATKRPAQVVSGSCIGSPVSLWVQSFLSAEKPCTPLCRYGDTGASSSAPSHGASLGSSMVQLRLTCLQDDAQPAILTKRFPSASRFWCRSGPGPGP